MAGEEILASLPEELISRINNLVTLFQAVGILTMIYIVWMIVKGIVTMRIYKKIRETYSDVKGIKRKLKVK